MKWTIRFPSTVTVEAMTLEVAIEKAIEKVREYITFSLLFNNNVIEVLEEEKLT